MIPPSARTVNRHAKLGCLVCGILIVTGAWMALERQSFLKDAVPAEAVITGHEKRGEGDDTTYAAVYLFRDADGHPVEGVSSRITSEPDGKVGDTIRVLYRAGERRASIEDRFSTKWGAAVAFGLIGFAFSFPLGLAVYLSGKRLREQRFPQRTAE